MQSPAHPSPEPAQGGKSAADGDALRRLYAAGQTWGEAQVLGFQQVPHALLRNQFRLRLSPLDLLIILNITMFWWTADNRPYPTIERIAQRMGVSRRSVERRISYMEKRRLLKRMPFETNEKGKKIRRFDMSGLVDAVEGYARQEPAFTKRQDRIDAASSQVPRREHRPEQ